MKPLSSYRNQLKMDSVPTHRAEIENSMKKNGGRGPADPRLGRFVYGQDPKTMRN